MIVTFERDIKNELKVLEGKIQDHLKKTFPEESSSKENVFIIALALISDILFKTSLKHEEWHHFADNIEDKQFAFFPGYVDNNGNRIFHIGYLNKGKALKGIVETKEKKDITDGESDNYEKFNFDFWYNKDKHTPLTNNNELKKFDEVSLLSLAYHFLFLGKRGNNSAATFSSEVGGTHQWASAIADEIAINDSLDPLELLAFYDKKREARDNQLKYRSWINIPFELKGAKSIEVENAKDNDSKKELIQKEIYEWCESVVNKLYFPSNSKEIDKIKERWPYNPNDEDIYNNNKYILIYRAYIVAFWMQLVLNPDKLFEIKNNKLKFNDNGLIKNANQNLVFDAWFDFTDYYINTKRNAKGLPTLDEIKDIDKYKDSEKYKKLDNEQKKIEDEIIKELKKYELLFTFRKKRIDLLKAIIENKNNPIIVHNYKYWYTIPFKHRLDFSSEKGEHRKETGSAMILSNYLLDGEYFRFTIPWLNQMYNAMREYDTAQEVSLKINEEIVEKINELLSLQNIEQIKRKLDIWLMGLKNPFKEEEG